MSGIVYRAIRRKTFEFTSLASAAYTEFVAETGIDVSNYVEATLMVRVHSISMSGTQQLDVIARADGPTTEDPALDFVKSTALATASITASDTAGKLYVVAVTSPFGSHLRLSLKPTQTTPNTTFVVNISADIVAKS